MHGCVVQIPYHPILQKEEVGDCFRLFQKPENKDIPIRHNQLKLLFHFLKRPQGDLVLKAV